MIMTLNFTKYIRESASIDQDDDEAVEEHNLALRRAMAESHKVEVEPMIAYEFSEDANVDLDDVPLSDPKHLDYNYDPALAKDKCFRFLLGTGMVEENGEILSSTLNTTMRATYQLYGIDLVTALWKLSQQETLKHFCNKIQRYR